MTSLAAYLENPLRESAGLAVDAPCPDEAHLPWWRSLAATAPRGEALIARLGEALPTLRLAIAAGASAHPAYDALVREARPYDEVANAGSIEIPLGGPFARPESIGLSIAEHPAGALPVLSIADRGDFVRFYRALGARGEAIAVPHDVHALYVSGLPNPGRLRELRAAWTAGGSDAAEWPDERARRAARDRCWFHDRLILVHPGGYGEVKRGWRRHVADEAAWHAASMAIRIEHELAHHATHRLLGSHRLHLHDELIADFMGFTRAIGTFDAALFLEALGVPESPGNPLPEGARFRHYLGGPGGLDESDLPALRSLVAAAAASLERFAAGLPVETSRLAPIRAIAAAGIDGLASGSWADRALDAIGRRGGAVA